jgi:ABC-type taurine transport system ATPase subunit
LQRWNSKPSRKGTGFQQPLEPHEHRHVDISYLNIVGAFFYLCSHNVREAACLGNRVILFSPNPGRIREEFKIDLERPRDINSTQLAIYSTEIMRALKGYVTAEVAE